MAKHQNTIMNFFLNNPSASKTHKQLACEVCGEARSENVSNDIRLLAAAGYLVQDYSRGPYRLSSPEAASRFLEAASVVTKAGTKAAAPKAAAPWVVTARAFDALADALEAEGIEVGDAMAALEDAMAKAREKAEADKKAAEEAAAKKAALEAALKAAEGDDALKAALQAALDAMEGAAAAEAEAEG